MNTGRRISAILIGGILAMPLMAQTCPSGLTMVQDVIYGPISQTTGLPRLFSGTVTISMATPIAAGGATYGAIPYAITVVGGQFRACLSPNDVATPANSQYNVKYDFHDAVSSASWRERWNVITSDTPVKIAPLRVVAGSLFPYPPVAGTSCLQSVNGVMGSWSVCGPTHSASPLSWPSLTSSAWASLSLSSWSTLTGGSAVGWSSLTSSAWASLSFSSWSTLTR